MSTPVGIGIIGAGNISTQYLETLSRFPDVRIVFIADLDLERAAEQAAAYDVPISGTVAELLATPEVEIVVNLTIPAAHVEVGLQALAAGKHVWAEKPLGLDRESARRLLDEASARGLRVASAPDTVLGAGLQSARRIIAEGRIGEPVSALAILQSPGPDRWHPNPAFLFDVGGGPLFDMGPYYLTALVQLLGPVARVFATGSTARRTRTINAGPHSGEAFPVRVATQHNALLEFENGTNATLIVSFESDTDHHAFDITGTAASVVLPDPNLFDGPTTLISRDGTREVVAETGAAHGRGLGVLELARAIRTGVPERASGELAFHVLDIMVSITEAAEHSSAVVVESTVAPAEILPATWDPETAAL